MIKADDLVNSNQEMQAGLTELTGQELSEMNGGYAAYVTSLNGPFVGTATYATVLGRNARDPQVVATQRAYGLSEQTIATGISIADTSGGVFFPAQAAAKLAG
jgi:hypothetical protein